MYTLTVTCTVHDIIDTSLMLGYNSKFETLKFKWGKEKGKKEKDKISVVYNKQM